MTTMITIPASAAKLTRLCTMNRKTVYACGPFHLQILATGKPLQADQFLGNMTKGEARRVRKAAHAAGLKLIAAVR